VETIALVGADKMEFAGVRRRCRRWTRLPWPVEFAARALFPSREYLCVANGAGPRLAAAAARAALEREAPGRVVSVGFCGGLDPALRPGDLFLAGRVEAIGQKISYTLQLPSSSRPVRSGVLISMDRVAHSAREKGSLGALGAHAVEMETAGVAAEAERLGVPCYCVRAVTDGADETFVIDFNRCRRAGGRIDYSRVLLRAIADPFQALPQLIRLRVRSWRAAEALGEYLADCRF
jgi:adenosylhomocysteine nucleosidase